MYLRVAFSVRPSVFSVPLWWNLNQTKTHHRDTKNTEDAQSSSRVLSQPQRLVLDDIALIVAGKILSWGDTNDAFEVAAQVALIEEARLKRGLRQRSSIAN